MSLSRLSASDRRAVAAATLAAGLLIAQQVAARAVRDALFLSAFQVKSLPLVMGASAIAALAGAELLSVGLSRKAPSRLVPAVAGLSALLLAALVGGRPHLAPGRRRPSLPARRRLRRSARLRLLVDGQRAVRPVHGAEGGRADRRRGHRGGGRRRVPGLGRVARSASLGRRPAPAGDDGDRGGGALRHTRAGARATRPRRPGRPASRPSPSCCAIPTCATSPSWSSSAPSSRRSWTSCSRAWPRRASRREPRSSGRSASFTA